MQLNLNFNALTKLKDWWQTVKSNFEIIETECTATRTIAENACTPEQAQEYLAELVNSNAEYLAAITAFKNLYEESGNSTAALEEIFGERVSLTEYNTHKNNTNIHHTHTNKSVLDGITADKVSGWNGKSDVVFGVYTGDGTAERTINLGFRPTAVEVYTDEGVQSHNNNGWVYYGGLAFDGKPCYSNKNWRGTDGQGTSVECKIIEICDNGFKISYESQNSIKNNAFGQVRSYTNENNTIYYFTAYKNGEIMVIE